MKNELTEMQQMLLSDRGKEFITDLMSRVYNIECDVNKLKIYAHYTWVTISGYGIDFAIDNHNTDSKLSGAGITKQHIQDAIDNATMKIRIWKMVLDIDYKQGFTPYEYSSIIKEFTDFGVTLPSVDEFYDNYYSN